MDMTYFSIPNYTMVKQNRRLSTHGGLITYIHNDFTYQELNNELPITLASTLSESLFLEVWQKTCQNQKYTIGNIIYRLPLYISDDLAPFTREFTDLLNIRIRSKFVYICRDYNIDLLKMSSINDYCLFHENVLSCTITNDANCTYSNLEDMQV